MYEIRQENEVMIYNCEKNVKMRNLADFYRQIKKIIV